jgi:hypothetical protein
MRCLDVVARHGHVRAFPSSRLAASADAGGGGGRGEAAHAAGVAEAMDLRVVPTKCGGFRPLALVLTTSGRRRRCDGGEEALGGRARNKMGSSARGGGMLPLAIVVGFAGMPERKVVEVGAGVGGGLEVLGVSAGGYMLVTTAHDDAHRPCVWLVVKGGRLNRDAGAGGGVGGARGSGGLGAATAKLAADAGEVVWVGMSLSLSHIVTEVHSCPRWAPKSLVPPGGGRGGGGQDWPCVWMRVQVYGLMIGCIVLW